MNSKVRERNSQAHKIFLDTVKHMDRMLLDNVMKSFLILSGG